MSAFLDDVSRIVASPVSRRKTLRLVCGAFVGAVSASLGFGRASWGSGGPDPGPAGAAVTCPQNQTACGSQCCNSSQSCCNKKICCNNNESCCGTGGHSKCCPPGKVCCKGLCCTPGPSPSTPCVNSNKCS